MSDTTASAPAVERTRGFHFEGFDGLRAIAAIAVALTHSAFISGFNVHSDTWGPFSARLDVGVAVFFVISGFLLYRPFVLARFAGTDGPRIGSYFWRRFLRIFPAFWLVFTVVLIVPQFHGLTWKTPSFGGLVAHYTLTHIYFHNHVLGPVQQSWTLATELSFYVMLPVWAALMRRCGRSANAQLVSELLGLAFLYCFSVAFRIWAFYGPPKSFNGQYNTWLPARVDLFALGMLIAVASAWLQARDKEEPGFVRTWWFPIASWALAALSFLILSKGFGLDDPGNRGPVPNFSHVQQMLLQFWWGPIGFFLVLPAVFGVSRGNVVRAIITNPVLQWLGLVSYGIYLWHEAIIDWYLHLTNPVPFASSFWKMTGFMAVFTIVAAAVSYYAVERPVLRFKDRRPGTGRPRGPRPSPAPDPGAAAMSEPPQGR